MEGTTNIKIDVVKLIISESLLRSPSFAATAEGNLISYSLGYGEGLKNFGCGTSFEENGLMSNA